MFLLRRTLPRTTLASLSTLYSRRLVYGFLLGFALSCMGAPAIMGTPLIASEQDPTRADGIRAIEGVEGIDRTDARPLIYVIPVTEAINQANLFILRRGLKEAIRSQASVVILDMDTPGGRLDICLEMMEMLDYFEGLTLTYVNPDAISAGAFIAAASDRIYFSPRGKMGAAAVIQGTGEEVPETAKMKIESYLFANIRQLSEGHPYRADVIRAMFDADYELVIDGAVIKEEGALLTVTAKQSVERYGPAEDALLAEGIYESLDAMLEALYPSEGYRLERFALSYSETWAKALANLAPIFLGIGLLLLFVEFKTPGFGLFGIAGIGLVGLFFISQNIAGLAGNEAWVVFILGLICFGIEIFVLPGLFVFGLLGLILMLGALLYAMADFWPDNLTPLTFELWELPLQNLTLALGIAIVGALIFTRLFKGSFVERSLVLSRSLDSGTDRAEEEASPKASVLIGKKGRTITRLNPTGMIDIEGRQYEAHAEINYIEKDQSVLVCSVDNFKIDVKKLEDNPVQGNQ